MDQPAPYALCLVLDHTVEPVGCWAMRAPLSTGPSLHTDTGHLMGPTVLIPQATASLLDRQWPRGSGVPQQRGLQRGNKREQFLQPMPERCPGRRGTRRKPGAGEVALVGHGQSFGHSRCLCSRGQLAKQGLGGLCRRVAAAIPCQGWSDVFLCGIGKPSFALEHRIVHHISLSSS